MKLDVLAFATHPDDVELFCGGTILKLIKKKFAVGVVDLTRGELGSRGSSEIRNEEGALASKKMGLSYRTNLEIPDGDVANSWENRSKIIEEIRKTKPELVLLPFWKDRHPDHKNASLLIKQSVFQSGLQKIESGYQPHRPSLTVYYYQHYVNDPVFVVDISGQFDDKLEVMQVFRSQFYDKGSKSPETFISSKAFWENIETRARYFGFRIGASFGEPFFVEHPVNFNNLYKFFA